jgi:hypothetical protein
MEELEGLPWEGMGIEEGGMLTGTEDERKGESEWELALAALALAGARLKRELERRMSE